jgi:hypothetical protein
MYVRSFRVLTNDCTLVHKITPLPNHVNILSLSESICVHSHLYDFHFCCYVQMDNIGSASADVEA